MNSGTSTYVRGGERLRQRGTAAHNTLRVDSTEQSEVWASHRCGRRARPANVTGGELWAEGAHDGFSSLHGRPVHGRRVDVDRENLIVTDRVQGAGTHRVETFFHVHPEVEVEEHDGGILLKHSDEVLARMQIEGPARVSVEPSSWHPGFNLSVPARCLRTEWSGSLPYEQHTRIAWESA